MFGSVVLDVAIGMAFVYLLLSLIATVVQEIIAAFLQLRPANLLRGVRSLFSGNALNGVDLVESVYDHGLIRGLYLDPVSDLVPAAKRAVCETTTAADKDRADVQKAVDVASVAQAASEADPGTVDLQALSAEASKVSSVAGQRADASGAAKINAKHALIDAEAKIERGLRDWLRARLGFPAGIPLASVSDQALLPAYIPSRTFALALTDILNTGNAEGAEVMTAIRASLAKHCGDEQNKAAQALQALALNAPTIAEFQKNLENWYNDSMDRASGWYKRYVQKILLMIGIVLAVIFNVDTVRVARTLWFDRDSRQAMVNAADQYQKTHDAPAATTPPAVAPPAASGSDTAAPASPATVVTPPQDSAATAAALTDKLKNSALAFNKATTEALLPVGWKQSPLHYVHTGWLYLHGFRFSGAWWSVPLDTVWRCLALLMGWLITAMAISLGAPFWFDTLNKFMVVRSTVKPQEKSQNEPSKS